MKVGLGKISPGKISPAKISPGKIGLGEISPAKVSPAKVDPLLASQNDGFSQVGRFGGKQNGTGKTIFDLDQGRF